MQKTFEVCKIFKLKLTFQQQETYSRVRIQSDHKYIFQQALVVDI